MANKTIRGITVEIGGNTTKLGKALEDGEKKSRSLQGELKEIQKQLKFDPTNVELLSQKQTVLTQNISETSSKLETLKEAEKQVIAQFERGEVAEEQVRALQREIIKTEQSLGDMKKELTTTEKALKDLADGTEIVDKNTKEYKESVNKAKQELKEFGDDAKEAFDKVKTGVTVLGTAVAATGGYALKVTTEFDKAYNTLITRTGATVEEMNELNASMERVYANNFGESIEDVAITMATVRNNTKLTGEELETTTQYALLLRDTFEFDVNESTRSAKMLMDQYGLSAESAYNLIAQGAQNGLDKNGDLLDTINEYAVHFKSLGLNADDMFNMLANGAESGTFSVDKLGDAIKEFGIRAKDGSDSSAKAFKALGLNAQRMTYLFAQGGEDANYALNEVTTRLFEMTNPIEQNTVGVALFGTMWEDLGVEGVKAIFNVNGKLSESNDALTKINEHKYDDIGSALQGLGRTVETDIINPLGEELKPVVEDVIESVKSNGPQIKNILSAVVTKVGEFVNWIVNNGPTILSIIGGVGAAFVTWKVASLINGVVGAIKAFKLANEGATIAQWALNVAMNANPIGIIITAVVGLVTAFILLWKNCEGFRNFWINLWENIKAAFWAFVEWISPTIEIIKEFFVSLWENIKTIWNGIIASITAAWDGIVESLRPLIDAISGAFQEAWEVIKIVWDAVAPYFQGVWEYIKAVFALAKEILGLYFANAWEAIKAVWSVVVDYFKTIWENIKLVFSVVKTDLAYGFIMAWESIKAVWNIVVSYFTAIWNTIRGIFSVVKAVLTGNFRDAWEGIKGIVNTWVDHFKNVWNNIKNVFGSVTEWFRATFSSAWEAIKGVFSNWGEFFNGLWNTISNTFSKIGTNISNAMSQSVRSGLNGVISAIEQTINGGIKLINGAIGIINEIPGVNIGFIKELALPRLARGAIVNKPTIAEIGEDGAEAIIPLEKNTEWLDKVANKLNTRLGNSPLENDSALFNKLDKIYDRLNRLQVVLDNGTLIGEILDGIDAGLADKQILNERMV